MAARPEGWPRVTLADIAAHTGYSRPLVSIVMRDAPGASDETRRRVLATAEELGYRPDHRARSMAGHRSWSMGVLFGVVGTFHFDLLDGLYAAAERHRYGLMVSPITKQRDESQALKTLHDFRFDGLIMLGPPTPTPVMAGRLPVVTVGWHVKGPSVDSVRTSDVQGMLLAVDHLLTQGHVDIAHIDGGVGLVAKSRREAFLEAMQARGLERHARTVPGGETQLDGQRAALDLVHASRRPSAVIAYNDDVAVAAIAVFQERRLKVPEEISVVGWDNTDTASLSPIPLTTVAQDSTALSAVAFELLLDRVNRKQLVGEDVVLTPSLVRRSSTAPPRRGP